MGVAAPWHVGRIVLLGLILAHAESRLAGGAEQPRANNKTSDNVFHRGPDEDGPLSEVDEEGGNREVKQGALCLLNNEGLYGDANAARNSGAKAFVLQFLYQTSLVPGTSTPALTNEVVPDVDRAVVTSILPNFFDCSEISTRQRLQRELQSGTIEAISALPLDVFVQRNCFATVVASGVLDIAALERVVVGAIQTAFQDGSVARAISTPLVLDVSFLTNDMQTVPPIGSPTTRLTPAPSPTRAVETQAPVSFNLPPTTSSPTLKQSTILDTSLEPSSPAPSIASNKIETTNAPVKAPTKKKKVAPWWVWLLTAIGGAALLLGLWTLYDYIQERNAAAAVYPDRPKQHRRSDDEDEAGVRRNELNGVYFPPPTKPVDAVAPRPPPRPATYESDAVAPLPLPRPPVYEETEEEASRNSLDDRNVYNGRDEDYQEETQEDEEDEDDNYDIDDKGVKDKIDEDDIYNAEDDEYLDELGELEDFGDNSGTATSYIEEEVSSETAFNLNVQNTKGFVTA